MFRALKKGPCIRPQNLTYSLEASDRAPFQGRLKSLGSLIGLPKSKQRAAVAVAAGFVPTHEAPGVAPRVALLAFEVIDPFSKIEPDHSVSRATPLRLSFIAKRAQWSGGRICSAACDDQRCQQAHRVR
jgi:hypothetical protein